MTGQSFVVGVAEAGGKDTDKVNDGSSGEFIPALLGAYRAEYEAGMPLGGLKQETIARRRDTNADVELFCPFLIGSGPRHIRYLHQLSDKPFRCTKLGDIHRLSPKLIAANKRMPPICALELIGIHNVRRALKRLDVSDSVTHRPPAEVPGSLQTTHYTPRRFSSLAECDPAALQPIRKVRGSSL